MDSYEIKSIINDDSRVFVNEEIDKQYLTDGLHQNYGKADILVLAENALEIQKVIKYAHDKGINVTVRGAGTGLTGAVIPLYGGIILDVSRMNKILDIDEENMTLTVEPGVLLEDVQKFVEERNYFYPPDPGEKTATIGGNVSTNAGGMRAVKYGVTRDYVRKLEIVTGNGEKITVGSNTIKNSSGLDLKDLIIGSEGTLAVITKIVLKIIPKPEKTISILVPFNTLKEGIKSVTALLKTNSNPTAIEFMEKDVAFNAEKFLDLELPTHKGDAYLILTFDGDEKSININKSIAEEVVIKNGALDFINLNKEESEVTWKIRGALCSAVTAGSEQIPIDIVVPVTKISDFAYYAGELSKKYNIKIVYFGHAGDGNVHLCVIRNGMQENEWKEKSEDYLIELYKKSYELNGIPSGEHGIGYDKKKYFVNGTDKLNIEIMKSIKQIFDSKFILNKGKVYTD